MKSETYKDICVAKAAANAAVRDLGDCVDAIHSVLGPTPVYRQLLMAEKTLTESLAALDRGISSAVMEEFHASEQATRNMVNGIIGVLTVVQEPKGAQ